MIATLHTNVLVSGTVFGGGPGSVINAAIDRRFTLALSPAILTEYENVLSRRKFGLLPEAVVDCAVEAGADVIVSGDRGLTELKQVEGITVVTSAMFTQFAALLPRRA